MYRRVLVVFFVCAFLGTRFASQAEAATVTYTSSNLSLDTNSALYNSSNVRKTSGAVYLNWNRPAVDSNHIGYWRFNDGSGTSATDDSSNANTGTLSSSSKPAWITAPFAGSSALKFTGGTYISAGNILNYERTQAWTMMAAIKLSAKPTTASVIFSNVKDTPYPGYEVWIDSSGHLRVRVIHSYSGNMIGIIGTTDVTDNTWHQVSVSYDGSSTAAGVKVYLDGATETTSVESDTLSASIVDNTNQGPFIVGNQNLQESAFNLIGYLDEFSLSNVVRSASYISQYATAGSLPPVDSNTVLFYHLNEGSGTSVTDSSNNSYTGTITGTTAWAIDPWMGSYELYYDGTDNYVTMPHISDYNLGSQFTLTGWANSTVAPGTGGLFHKIVGSSPFPGWGFNPGYLNTIQWWDSSSFRDTTVAATTGWHQYVVRFNSGTLDIFVDGTNIKTTTGVSTPSTSNSVVLSIGNHVGLSGGAWNGYISQISIANTARSTSYVTTYSTRYPASGVTSLSSVSTGVSSGGGDFGTTQTITQLEAVYSNPSSSTLQYRIGTGSSAAAATSDKTSQSYADLSSTNTINKTGRFVDFDIKLIPSTDTLKQTTPSLTSVTLTYATPTATPTPTTTPTAAPASSTSTATSSSSSSNAAPTCGTPPPGPTAPSLFSAVATGPTTIELTFTAAEEPFDHYTLAYGPNPGSQAYGIPTLSKRSRTARIEDLTAGTTYYFRIRGGNGCSVGGWSNELSATTPARASRRQLAIVSTDMIPNAITPAPSSLPNESFMESKPIASQSGTLYLTIRDTKQSLISDARITVVDTQQQSTTDSQGIAVIHQLHAGMHTIRVAIGPFQSEQSLALADGQSEWHLELTVNDTRKNQTPFYLIGAGISSFFLMLVRLWHVGKL